ncbi:hypothetical protein CGU37_13080 [Pseudomonas fluorescens]|nr:hypothetical protein CGU36_14035 [Pseudomonas fluorescens]OZO48730.1 hypothetical protein CGU37_13080 [Pseudomonas fluorescens]TGY18318.1 hypothetical protein E5845_13180 [Pseudomonas fluorescens]
MDLYRYKMSKYLYDRIFVPCRTKSELIIRIGETVAELTFSIENEKDYDVVIAIGKLQRIFFVSEKKIFSVYFPFSIRRNEDPKLPHFFELSGVPIDSYMISRACTAIAESFGDENKDIYSFADSVISSFTVSDVEGVQTVSEDVWMVVKRLMMLEEGYLRYDNDPDNYNALTHPLDHLDVFYSPSCTFKIGLPGQIGHDHLLDILDPLTRCRIIDA